MMDLTTSVVGLLVCMSLAQEPGVLTGTMLVVAVPTPGVEIMAVRGEARYRAVTKSHGTFEMRGLPSGRYRVTAALAGFRRKTKEIAIVDGETSRIEWSLEPGALVEVLWVLPGDLHEAHDKADLVAHVRILSTEPPSSCGSVVETAHQARVLAVFKAPRTTRLAGTNLRLMQEAAGACLEEGRLVVGLERPVYQVGGEYVMFLRQRPDGYGRLAGPVWALRVSHGRVTLPRGAQPQASQQILTIAALTAELGQLGVRK